MQSSAQSQSVPTSSCFSQLKENYICPIGYCLMQDPMILPCCQNTFQRIHIQTYLNQVSTCPICRRKVNFSQAIFNRSLKKAIQTFQKMMKKKQQKRRRQVQAQLNAKGSQAYNRMLDQGLRTGIARPEDLTMSENLSQPERLVRLAINSILRALELQQREKLKQNSALDISNQVQTALNFTKSQFARVITE